MISRAILVCLLFQAASAFIVSTPKLSHALPKVTTVGASVIWEDAQIPVEPKAGRLTRLRKRLTNLFRFERKGRTVELENIDQTAEAISVEDPITLEGNRIKVETPVVITKPVEFRTKPLNIPSQPRPAKQELELSTKYANIESVEERAFQILVDLGMVEIHN